MGRKKKNPLEGDVLVIHDELGAIPEEHQNKLNLDGLVVVHSADVDASFKELEPNSNRWDYYIGTRKHGEIYVEVHKVNEAELAKIYKKAEWLRGKIEDLGWPQTEGRPLFIAPTSGIDLGAGEDLRMKLSLRKIIVVMKGDKILDEI